MSRCFSRVELRWVVGVVAAFLLVAPAICRADAISPIVQLKFDGDLTNSGTGGPAAGYWVEEGPANSGEHSFEAALGGHQGMRLTNPINSATNGDAVGLNYTLGAEGTIAFWIQPTYTYDWMHLFDSDSNAGRWRLYSYNNTGSAARLRWRLNGYVEKAGAFALESHQTDYSTCTDDWYHIALTWKNTDATHADAKMYVDGALVASANVTTDVHDGKIYIGGGGGSGSVEHEFANGVYEDFRIYNQALDVDQIGDVITSVPEPSTLCALLGMAFMLMSVARRHGRSTR